MHWNVTSEDWEPARSPDQVAGLVVDRALAVGDGAVVLQHTWPDQTLASLRDVAARLRDRGATFVTVDALPALPVPQAP